MSCAKTNDLRRLRQAKGNKNAQRVRQWCSMASNVVMDRICCVGPSTTNVVDDEAIQLRMRKDDEELFHTFDVTWYEEQLQANIKTKKLPPITSYNMLGIDEENHATGRTDTEQSVELIVDGEDLVVAATDSEVFAANVYKSRNGTAPSSTTTATTAPSTVVEDSQSDFMDDDHSVPISLAEFSFDDEENCHPFTFSGIGSTRNASNGGSNWLHDQVHSHRDSGTCFDRNRDAQDDDFSSNRPAEIMTSPQLESPQNHLQPAYTGHPITGPLLHRLEKRRHLSVDTTGSLQSMGQDAHVSPCSHSEILTC